MLTIFLYVPSCVHSSPKRGRFRSGLWRGGEAAPAPVEYRSAVPGGLLKAAERANAQSGELARPGLRRGRVRERLKARRRRAFPHGPAEGDGERRSGGYFLPALRDQGGATFPRGIGGVTAPMPVGPFAPESKTGVPKIAERGAPGRHPSLTKAPTARRSAPPRLRLPHTPGEGRGIAEACLPSFHPPPLRHPGRSAAQSRDPGAVGVSLDPGSYQG